MTLIQRLVFETLGGYSALSTLLGARIYPDAAPQEVAKPYIVWQELSLVQLPSLADGTPEAGSLNNHLIQVTSWALSATLARDVNAAARAAMNQASGFKSVLRDTRTLDYEPDTKLFGMQSDFSIWLKT